MRESVLQGLRANVLLRLHKGNPKHGDGMQCCEVWGVGIPSMPTRNTAMLRLGLGASSNIMMEPQGTGYWGALLQEASNT